MESIDFDRCIQSQCLQEWKACTVSKLEVDGKDEQFSRKCLDLANRYHRLSATKYFTKCLYYYRQALLNVKPSQGNKFHKHSMEYIYYKLGKLYSRHKHYHIALDNVKLAMELTNDAQFKCYLEAICAKLSAKAIDGITGVEHEESIPLHDKLKVQSNPHKGRFIETTNTVDNWTCLLKERAISVVYSPKHILTKCSHCHRTPTSIFYPCRSCAQVVFCSKHCENEAHQAGIHRWECGHVQQLSASHTAWHAFRILVVVGLNEIIQFYQQPRSNEYSIDSYLKDNFLVDKYFWQLGKEEKLKIYELIDSLVDHKQQMVLVDDQLDVTLRWAVKIVFIACADVTKLTELELSLLLPKVVRLIWKAQLNTFACMDTSARNILQEYSVGSAIFIVSSFFNHDCDANTFWNVYQGVITINTVR